METYQTVLGWLVVALAWAAILTLALWHGGGVKHAMTLLTWQLVMVGLVYGAMKLIIHLA
jgi:hypothetical protein